MAYETKRIAIFHPNLRADTTICGELACAVCDWRRPVTTGEDIAVAIEQHLGATHRAFAEKPIESAPIGIEDLEFSAEDLEYFVVLNR